MDALQILYIGESPDLGFRLCGSFSYPECIDYRFSLGSDLDTGSAAVISELNEFAVQNLRGVIYASIGMIVAGLFGFFLKRPMVKSAIQNESFKVAVQGYESLITRQAAQIAYYQAQDSIHLEYQAILIKRLREAQEQNTRGSS